jgi:hypothetical protein
MATTIRKADYFKLAVPNKPGQAARLLSLLKEEGVNLLAISGFPRAGRAQIDFIPEDAALFKKAMKRAKIAVGEKKTVFLVQGDDRIGAIAEVAELLAKADINITALDAVADGTGRFGALLWVKPAHVAKAAKVLSSLTTQ